jgi:hypothetical protein
MNRKTQICTLNLSAGGVRATTSPTQRRLVEAFSLLERIEADRASRGNSLLGNVIEERIVWRELIDLELQDVDDQIERITAAADDFQPVGQGKGIASASFPRAAGELDIED